ncbi:hypothetical protein [Nocardia miyunensis]|uniref:hypothetical protein n=1 Tax=Nocardia miyunensis TaxID=282684 RepID=UPI000830F7B1|nr:hypothetical protein [Nocardia miyunensis]
MRLHLLGKGGSKSGDCPSLLATDQGTYVAQGWRTGRADTVEIPHLLTGFAEPDTYLGATLTDTGRGTFLVTGRPISEPDVLAQLTLADDESAIEIPKNRRAFYGAEAK